MTTDEIIEALNQVSREELEIWVILLILAAKRNLSTTEGYPPGVSIGEMAERWATWGVGPRAKE